MSEERIAAGHGSMYVVRSESLGQTSTQRVVLEVRDTQAL